MVIFHPKQGHIRGMGESLCRKWTHHRPKVPPSPPWTWTHISQRNTFCQKNTKDCISRHFSCLSTCRNLWQHKGFFLCQEVSIYAIYISYHLSGFLSLDLSLHQSIGIIRPSNQLIFQQQCHHHQRALPLLDLPLRPLLANTNHLITSCLPKDPRDEEEDVV